VINNDMTKLPLLHAALLMEVMWKLP